MTDRVRDAIIFMPSTPPLHLYTGRRKQFALPLAATISRAFNRGKLKTKGNPEYSFRRMTDKIVPSLVDLVGKKKKKIC